MSSQGTIWHGFPPLFFAPAKWCLEISSCYFSCQSLQEEKGTYSKVSSYFASINANPEGLEEPGFWSSHSPRTMKPFPFLSPIITHSLRLRQSSASRCTLSLLQLGTQSSCIETCHLCPSFPFVFLCQFQIQDFLPTLSFQLWLQYSPSKSLEPVLEPLLNYLFNFTDSLLEDRWRWRCCERQWEAK